MLSIRLDGPVPIGEQILTGIRTLIAQGELKPGDELPPVRQLAGDLGVNLNTVARAYRALESDGLLQTARGRGTRITSDVEHSRGSTKELHARLELRMQQVLADFKLAGLLRSDALALVSKLTSEFWSDSNSCEKEGLE